MKFKGHTIIEMKNVVTGEVEKYEDDNMLTNAIGKIVDFAARHNWTQSLDLFTSHLNLLSSLVLYDSAITESADQVWLPAGVKPVGYGIAGDTNSYTGRAEWGIYNPNESDTSGSTMKKWVWDFTTSHGNGTISALGLTHYNAGDLGLGAVNWSNMQRQYNQNIAIGTMMPQSSKGKQSRNNYNVGTVGTNTALNDGSYQNFCIDSVNNLKYMVKVCRNGISVISHSMNPVKFDLFSGCQNWQDYTEEIYAETFSDSGDYFFNFYNSDEQVLYFWFGGNTDRYSSNVSVKIHKFDCVNKVLTKDWNTFVFSGNSYNHAGTNFVVTNSAVYFVSINTQTSPALTYIKKYTFASGNTEVIYSSSNYANWVPFYGRKSYILNGRIYWYYIIPNGLDSSQSIRFYTGIVDTSDDTFLYTNFGYYTLETYNDQTSRFNIVPPIDNTQVVFGTNMNANESQVQMMNIQSSGAVNNQSIGNTFTPCNYLATINNLSEPVVKTAEKTMKVTYIITQESEE